MSNKNLYGAELSKAIRQAIKEAGVKGVTVSCHTFSGGQEVTARVTLQPGDVRCWDDCKDEMLEAARNSSFRWIEDPDTKQTAYRDIFFSWDGEKQRRAIENQAKSDYDGYVKGRGFGTIMFGSQVSKEEAPCFTDSFFDRWSKVTAAVDSFHYDNSDPMTDYFDTNFYKRFEIVNKEAKA